MFGLFPVGWVLLILTDWLVTRLLGALAIGVMLAIAAWQTHQEGIIRTNRGVYRRDESPRRFLIEEYFWGMVFLLFFVGTVLHAFKVF